ncbi:radical SAM protein [bacterium]|nr:radical SAM protein [bacterium]
MKELLYCDFLWSGINFHPNRFSCCCTPYKGIFVEGNNIKDYLYDFFLSFEKKRTEAIEKMKKSIPIKDCIGCVHLKKYDMDSDETPDYIINNYNKNLINHIQINHFKHCDCGCIYCNQPLYKKTIYSKQSEYYDLLPLIKKLYDKKMVNINHLEVEFQGGSISVLDEFPNIVDFILENGVKSIQYFTNGLVYLPEIEKAIKRTNCLIICSIDSSTPETFLKIKRVNKFYDVINNVKKYQSIIDIYNSESHNSTITLKFILVDGVNDNLKELEGFIKIAENLKVFSCHLDLDYRMIMKDTQSIRYDIPKHYKDLYDFFMTKTREVGIIPWMPEYTKQILDKGYFDV